MARNIDPATVESFGDEWSHFDQAQLSDAAARSIFAEYFAIFSWGAAGGGRVGFRHGLRVRSLGAPDGASGGAPALHRSVRRAGDRSPGARGAGERELPPRLGGRCGAAALQPGFRLFAGRPAPCARPRACDPVLRGLLKPGAAFLVYLYYAFENRSALFRSLWRVSDWLRRGICRLPPRPKHVVTDALAVVVYWPLATLARLVERLGFDVENIPLSYYRKQSFFTMRTDSRDRFGTPLERRFTRVEIRRMMEAAGLEGIVFSDAAPYWCAVGYRR